MSTADPSLVTVRVGDAPSSDPAGRGELGAAAAAADTAAAPVVAPPKRRRLGTAGAAQVLLAAAAAAGIPAAPNPPAVARRTKKVAGRKNRASAAAAAAASAAAASTAPVPGAGTESTQAFMDMLGSVDIESPPLGNYSYNEFDGGVDGGTGEDDNEVEEVEARRTPESTSGLNKAGFEKWGMEIEMKRQRGQRGGPYPADGGGGGRSGGGGGGGGGWFWWFSSGGFWDAAKQTVLTILGIIAAFFLIANFNVLVAAAVNPLLLVLRQIRRAITFAAYCVSRALSAPASKPKPTPVESGEVAPAPSKGRVGMSARERVVSKWGSD